MDIVNKGSFTLPGEAGYEDLTLRLAEEWGADVIRDSDGTQLSDRIVSSEYDIYSTLCLIRMDNQWAKRNMDKLQQTYLMSFPVIADGSEVKIELLEGYFKDQFLINDKDDKEEWWQVFDRTTGDEIPASHWIYDGSAGTVIIRNAVKWHRYTVNFLAYRIWEEISAYNHVTNNWGDREHLMPIEPMYPEVQEHILRSLEHWLIEHVNTKVVRFTSLFYNFFWLWGSESNRRFIVNDWGGYGFSVNSYSIKEFERINGYRLKSEDFVNAGLYNNSYLPPSDRYRAWMDFINSFVVKFGRKCVDLVHKYGKKAYVFYNDHWIGMEPTLDKFKELCFDGIIDGIFSGFEARKVAGTKHVDVRELRLHPYFFPTGVNGAGTFVEGGNPAMECRTYWMDIRRALVRDCVDRLGFGGYLHLVEAHQEFIEYVGDLLKEFRTLKALHGAGKPYSSSFKVAILNAWGNMRAWSCRGHFNRGNFYNEVMESISGLPVNVEFISFQDIIETGIPSDIKVIINAGCIDDAWSGGYYWRDPQIIEAITEWVSRGGGLIGVGEPSAAKYGGQYFQMSHVLGVDRESGLSSGFDRHSFDISREKHFIMEDVQGSLDFGKDIENIFILNNKATVLVSRCGSPQMAINTFGMGRGVYLSGHKYSPSNIRLLHRAIYWAAGCEDEYCKWSSSNIYTECAYYPECGMLAVINNSGERQETVITDSQRNSVNVQLNPYEFTAIEYLLK